MIEEMPYRAVFFDAGETLVYAHPSFPELLSTVLAEEGLRAQPDEIREALPKVAEVFTRATEQRELWSTSPERSRRFWAGVYRTLLAELGLPFTQAIADRLYSVFTNVSNYRLFPDALPVLRKLREAGLGMGLISNFEEWLERLLDAVEVTTFFDVRVISGIEGIEKPDPDIFRLALERLGARPEESLYVGDNVTYDVEPARQVGMTGVLLDRRDRYPDFDGLRIASLDELPPLLGL
jgi:putative hydrolase of the HAD superfamily